MRVIDLIHNSEKTAFSFEILPPLKGTGIEKLYQTVDTLREFDPKYINITTHRSEYVYKDLGNGLFQRNRLRRRPGTVAVAAAIQNKYNITVVPHILCSGFTREETEYVLLDLQFLNITDLLVLRGDKAKHESVFTPEGDGYHHAIELQEQINNFNKGIFVDGSEMKVTASPFSYGVACYPEKHEEAPNIESDLYWLKKKVEAGAEYAVTQLFYDNKKYFEFVEQTKAAGATVETVVFDLSDEPATVNIKVAGSNRPYTLRIDYSAIMTPAKDLGFVDITDATVKEKYPYITIMRATLLNNVIKQKPTKKPNPDWWNPNEDYPGMTQTEAMAVLGDLKDPATYPGLENYENVNLTVLTMDAAKVKGRMEIDDQNSLTLSEVKGLVTVTGRAIGSKGSQGGRGILYGNNKVYSWQLPWIEKQPENIQFGWHFGFTAEGKLLCDIATMNTGGSKTKLHKVKFYEANTSEDLGEVYAEPYNFPNVLTYDCHNYLSGDWNVVSAAYGYPCFAKDGQALTYKQVLGNNGFSDSMGDNVYGQFIMIGKTFDGKVAIAIVSKENEGDSELTPLQAAYVLNKMGWKDIMCVGVTDWQSGSWKPGLMVDGKLVAGQDTDGSVFVMAFDAK